MRSRIIAFSILVLGCKGQERETRPPPPGDASAKEVALAGAAVLIGAGDIGVCGSTGDERTAAIVDSVLREDSVAKVENAVFTAGDNAYQSGDQGARDDFRRCFAPSWGTPLIMRFIHPAIGNHDYLSVNGPGYFEYFGERAGPQGKGYYSFDLGKWHLISLNSEIVAGVRRDFAQSRAQEDWLRKDLADHGKPCTLAYWHRPLFSSGTHGATPEADRLWMILYQNGVDLVVNGHDHHYERFLPQTPAGVKDSVRGIEQIIAGTGGGDLRGLRRQLMPNSAMQIFGHFGVLKLTLGDGEYRHAFLDIDGRVWDQGGRRCH